MPLANVVSFSIYLLQMTSQSDSTAGVIGHITLVTNDRHSQGPCGGSGEENK